MHLNDLRSNCIPVKLSPKPNHQYNESLQSFFLPCVYIFIIYFDKNS